MDFSKKNEERKELLNVVRQSVNSSFFRRTEENKSKALEDLQTLIDFVSSIETKSKSKAKKVAKPKASVSESKTKSKTKSVASKKRKSTGDWTVSKDTETKKWLVINPEGVKVSECKLRKTAKAVMTRMSKTSKVSSSKKRMTKNELLEFRAQKQSLALREQRNKKHQPKVEIVTVEDGSILGRREVKETPQKEFKASRQKSKSKKFFEIFEEAGRCPIAAHRVSKYMDLEDCFSSEEEDVTLDDLTGQILLF